MKRSVVVAVVLLLAGAGAAALVAARSRGTPEPDVNASPKGVAPARQSEGTGKGFAATERAAEAGKYLFLFFYKEEDEQTLAMRKVFEAAVAKAADRADSVQIDVNDASEEAIVKKYGLDRAPMPLVLAMAPNGAITGGFPGEFDEQKLLAAFTTPCTEKCMKALQENKLVFLCVQNAKTKSNQAAMEGVREYAADEQFGRAAEIVTLDPADAVEAHFLKDLRISPQTTEAVTVLLAPPGGPIARFTGAVTKDQIVAQVASAQSGPCANGQCGPGGCGPKK